MRMGKLILLCSGRRQARGSSIAHQMDRQPLLNLVRRATSRLQLTTTAMVKQISLFIVRTTEHKNGGYRDLLQAYSQLSLEQQEIKLFLEITPATVRQTLR